MQEKIKKFQKSIDKRIETWYTNKAVERGSKKQEKIK